MKCSMLSVAAVVVLLLSGWGQAQASLSTSADTVLTPAVVPGGADPMYTFIFDDPIAGIHANGLLVTTVVGTGIELASGTSLTVTQSPSANAYNGTYNLVPLGPGGQTSLNGSFIADDLLYPGSTPAQLDVYGLLFSLGGTEINIWSNGGSDNYTFAVGYGPGIYPVQGNNGTFELTAAVPEHASIAVWVLLGLCVGGWSCKRWC